ncbi:nucleoside triphosphate pyrophosphohydrolase [Acetobacter estunensis]|uniref:Nucleoside triphosphate pyrophosphohydrolase n=1 Tax=Acetobacter estunensis TaxID=104097 RepID=A0A967B4C8_9PROT|nr:nucleoside triphosphate pyrophosphohydrolase [Acetobacter estunensis]
MTNAAKAIERLVQIMGQLRDPETGCAWDVQQTPRTIAPYAIEEAYEVADAIERESWNEVADELGDLLLQVVFQSRMAQEKGRFNFADVANLIADKMVRRHPHVFSNDEQDTAAGQDLSAQWEQSKEEERRARNEHGALAGIPLSLPALLRARKLAARAARVGFDWPEVDGVIAKVHEEMAEVEAEIASGDRAALADEMGDLLFSVASLARRFDLDPEACLRQANDKFSRRFGAVEGHLAQKGLGPSDCSVEQLDAVWNTVKAQEKAKST